MPTLLIYACSAMLFVGAAPMPYGYYTLLRLIACGVFAYAAWVAYDQRNKLLPYAYAALALIFNPIIKIHLPKDIWILIDVGAGIFLLATAKFVTDEPSTTK